MSSRPTIPQQCSASASTNSSHPCVCNTASHVCMAVTHKCACARRFTTCKKPERHICICNHCAVSTGDASCFAVKHDCSCFTDQSKCLSIQHYCSCYKKAHSCRAATHVKGKAGVLQKSPILLFIDDHLCYDLHKLPTMWKNLDNNKKALYHARALSMSAAAH